MPDPALETDPETRLAVAFYRPTTNAIPTLPGAAVPTNFWPGVAAEFTATWPTNQPATQVAVIASQRGAGRLDPARYGGDWSLYVQNNPCPLYPSDAAAEQIGLNLWSARNVKKHN